MGLGQGNRRCTGSAEAGYAMAALLVGISVMAVLMSMALPVWTTFNKREREAELIWRGQQYARAIGLFQRKYANTYPPNVDILVEQRFLRKKYKDPITSEDFLMIPAAGGGNQPGNPQNPGKPQPNKGLATPPGKPQNPGVVGDPAPGSGFPGGGGNQPSIGIQGVVSKSGDKSIKIYNGRTKYNEWTFIHVASTQQPGFPGGSQKAPGKEPNPGGPFKNFPPGTRPPVSNPSSPFGPPGSPSGQPPPPGSKPVFGIGNPPKGQQ